MLSHAAEYSSNLKIYYNLLHPILYAPAAWPHHLFTVTAITSVMICINWHWLAKQARIFQPLAEAPEHVRRDDSTWQTPPWAKNHPIPITLYRSV